ncbi:uncharacterized protein vg isoform X1 [Dermacentor andersoni]|uniref:uncharacterized protein vg isoform X1 n=1 Tax=Dermacentor andersoni TaxID=34620 RepID=UPI0021552822|nr:transcription cofactor vestigial-like protein 2 isoform X1 [Dermacentor andersoni]
MSCTEVMYQPYSPYFPYHQRAAAAAASCPGAGAASGITAAQAACLDYKRFVSPKMHDLLAGSAAMAASSPATPPSSLQSLGPPRSTSSAGSSSSSHHSRNHHHNHHSGSGGTAANNSVGSGNNSSGHHGSSGRSSSSSSACAVAASSPPSTPLAARSPDREESSIQAGKAASSSSLPGGHTAAAQATGGGGSSPSSAAVSGGTSAVPGDAHYVSANCVVFTYYSGDISSVVDEHFSRALSESGAYDGTAGSSCKSGASQLKDAPPMSQRNFPASFWDCHQSAGSPNHGMSAAGAAMSSPVDLYAGSEAHPYHHAHHHAASAANAAALHASLQSDPWHYALTAPQAGPYSAPAFPRRSSAMHELAYSAGGAAHRFGAQQYGSLLLQPRSSRLAPATCTALDKGDAWASPAARYHHDQLTGHHVVDASGYQAAAHHHYGSMGAAAAAAAMTDPNSGGYMLELYKFQAMHAYR